MSKTAALRRLGMALAVLYLALFLAALGVRFWASDRAAGIRGPDHLAAAGGHVYLHMNGELLALSPSGALRTRQRLAALGLDDTPIDLRILRDGRLLIAGQRPATVRLCEPQRWECASVAEAAAGRLSAQFKVAIDEDRGRLLIADFDSSEVWAQPLAGGEPKALHAARILKGPNDVALDADGRLWVADSGHRRIVALDLAEAGAREAGPAFDVRNGLSRDGRDWPMMLAPGPDGRWWVTQVRARARGVGDVLVYHPQVGAQARIALPDDAYPTDIAPLGDAMLVTDMDGFRVFRVDAATRRTDEFGDAAFRAHLREAAERKARYETLSTQSLIGMIAFAVFMILAAVWATPKAERFTPRPAAGALAPSEAPAAALQGIHWLKRHPKTDRLIRRLVPASIALTVLMIGSLAGLLYLVEPLGADAARPERVARIEELKRMLAFMVVSMGALPAVMRFMVRRFRRQLGTDGHRLFLRQPDGAQVSFAPEQLVYSDRQIAYHDIVVAVQTGNRQPLYAEGEIEKYLAPLLRRARKLSTLGMFRYLLAHREAALMVNLAYALVVLAAMVATGAWRMLLRDFL